MSTEEKKVEDQIDEVKPDEKNETKDLIDENVALLKAKLKFTEDALEQEKALSESLTKKLKQAMDMIEEDTKAALLEKIIPRTSEPASILMLKSVEALVEQKRILDNAKTRSFQAGTPIVVSVKSPAESLYTVHDDYMAKFRK